MIEIKITGNTPQEVLDQLHPLFQFQVAPMAPSMSVLETPIIPPVFSAAPPVMAGDAPEEVAPTNFACTASPVGVEAKPKEEAPPTSSAPVEPLPTAPVAPPTEKVLSYEEVRALGIAAGRKHGNPAVRALLNRHFGVMSMTELSEEQRPQFLEKLGELDAQ